MGMNRGRVAFLVALLATALGPSAIKAAHPDDPYEPLAVGMRWESSVEITLPSGEVRYGSAIREITGTQTIAGKSYFVSVTRYVGLPGFTPLTTYQRKTADGIYTLDGPEGERPEYRETALPLAVGQRWTVDTGARGHFHVEKEENIVVAGRAFEKCLKIVFQSDGGTSHGAYYLAPHIGIVLDVAEHRGTRFRLALLSFDDGNALTR
jgi:hypothetical protein